MAHGPTKRLPQILVSLLCLAALSYFAVYAVAGRHGLDQRQNLLERRVAAEKALARLEAVRARLTNDVARLGATPPDPDLITELALSELGYAHPEARVIVHQQR
jgi:cell division protein FtsB